MSSEPERESRRRGVPRPAGAVVALLAAATLGCGRDTKSGISSVGRAGADSVWHAPGAQAGAGAVAAPTPGFTSAQGTPATGPALAVASAAVTAHLAPLPAAPLSRALGTEETASIAQIPAGTGHDLVVGNCLVCHAATMIEQQHKDTVGWNKTVTQMIAWGSPLPKGQQPVLVAYLAAHYPARAAGPPARQVP